VATTRILSRDKALGHKQETFDCLSTARYLQSAAATKNGFSADEATLLQRWESLVGNA